MISAILSLFIAVPAAWADVYTFPDRDIHISTAVQVQDYTLHFRDDATKSDLFYKPNVGGVFIPRISYRGLWAVSWGFNTPVGEDEKYLQGETRYNDIRFDFTFHSFTVNTHYSQYKGFFLDNSVAVNPLLTENDPKIQRPDMYSRNMGISVTWVWDHNTFSLPNLISQSERQERQGGSFLFGGSFNETSIRADAPVVPGSLQTDFDVLSNLSGGQFQALSLKAGYGFAWAKKWFLGGALMVGPGLTRRVLTFQGQEESKGWEPSGRAELLVAGGYNGDAFFTSLRIDVRQEYFPLTGSSSLVSPQLAAVTLSLGSHLGMLFF